MTTTGTPCRTTPLLRVTCLVVSALLVAAWVLDVWRVDCSGQEFEQEMPVLSWGLSGLTELGDRAQRDDFTWRELALLIGEQIWSDEHPFVSGIRRSYGLAGLVRALLTFALVWLALGWLPIPPPRIGATPQSAGALALLLAVTLVAEAYVHTGYIEQYEADYLIPDPVAVTGPSLWLVRAATVVSACVFAAVWAGRIRATRLERHTCPTSAPPPDAP